MPIACAHCGAENNDTAQLCYGCGQPLEGQGAERLLGEVLFDSYELVKIIGEGGMAVVYLGRNRLTEQEVAIKVLPPELAAYSEVKTRFLEEAKTLAHLEHPNIVHLINFAEDKGNLCLLMQYAEGETFEELIDRELKINGEEAVRVGTQVLDALAHAHDHGVVHRDIKPSNIICRSNGTVKVTDFGIAKVTRDNKLTQTGQTMGTVRYMAPEQVRGKGVDARTDIYSLGVSLYESVVGEPPFDGESQFEVMQMHLTTPPRSPRESGAELSPELEQVILTALRKRQEDRFQSAAEMRAALLATPEAASLPERSRDKMSIAMAETSLDVQTAEDDGDEVQPRRRTGLILAVVLGVVVLVAGGITLFLLTRGGDQKGKGGKGTAGPTQPMKRPTRGLPARHDAIDKLQKTLGKWKASKRFDDPYNLYLYSDRDVDIGQFAQAYLKAQQEYRSLLKKTVITREMLVGSHKTYTLRFRPITVVLVNQKLFNDPKLGIAETPKYQALKGLAFAYSDREDEELKYKLGFHFCPVQIQNKPCKELAEKFSKLPGINFY